MIDGRPHDRPPRYLVSLVHELCSLPSETEWVEFKVNHTEPQAIGRYISALANTAALVGKAFAYLVWGVRDEDHALVGTMFEPRLARVGNEELESWLLRLLEPKIDFRFFRVMVEGRSTVLRADCFGRPQGRHSSSQVRPVLGGFGQAHRDCLMTDRQDGRARAPPVSKLLKKMTFWRSRLLDDCLIAQLPSDIKGSLR